MANPLFRTITGGQNNFMSAFTQFMNQHKGQDPNALIQEIVQKNNISQDQLNQMQQQAQQLSGQFSQMKNMFGFR